MRNLDDQSDESLMGRIQGGDHEAFAILVRRHTTMFFGAAYRMCSQAQEAEDIVQDAFLKLWNKPEAYDPGKGAKFTTWFYRVVTNMAIYHMRRKKPQVDPGVMEIIADPSAGADEALALSDQQNALEVAIQDLPERQKVALNLCFYEGLSNREAAEVLGVGVKALESLLMRAKARLKETLMNEKEDINLTGVRFYA